MLSSSSISSSVHVVFGRVVFCISSSLLLNTKLVAVFLGQFKNHFWHTLTALVCSRELQIAFASPCGRKDFSKTPVCVDRALISCSFEAKLHLPMHRPDDNWWFIEYSDHRWCSTFEYYLFVFHKRHARSFVWVIRELGVLMLMNNKGCGELNVSTPDDK